MKNERTFSLISVGDGRKKKNGARAVCSRVFTFFSRCGGDGGQSVEPLSLPRRSFPFPHSAFLFAANGREYPQLSQHEKCNRNDAELKATTVSFSVVFFFHCSGQAEATTTTPKKQKNALHANFFPCAHLPALSSLLPRIRVEKTSKGQGSGGGNARRKRNRGRSLSLKVFFNFFSCESGRFGGVVFTTSARTHRRRGNSDLF